MPAVVVQCYVMELTQNDKVCVLFFPFFLLKPHAVLIMPYGRWKMGPFSTIKSYLIRI